MLRPESQQTPVLAHLGLNEVLVDRCQFDGQATVECLDDLRVALHQIASLLGRFQAGF